MTTRQDPVEVEILPIDATGAMMRAEIDIAVATAHAHKRKVSDSVNRAVEYATYDHRVAERCTYTLPRKDENGNLITGPSVHMLRLCATAWGNLAYGSRLVRIDREFVVAEGIAHDLESNTTIRKQVVRSICDRYGRRYRNHLIQSTCQAAMSIAERNTLVAALPPFVTEKVWASAKSKAIAGGGKKSLAATRDEVLKKLWDRWRIDEARALGALGARSREHCTQDQVIALMGLAVSVRDGAVPVDEAFPALDEAPVATQESGPEPAAPEKAPESPEKAPPTPEPSRSRPDPPPARAPREEVEEALSAVDELDLDGLPGKDTSRRRY